MKVGAVSLNFRDKAIVDGFYEPHLVPKPLIPVSDASGTVVAVGEGVSRFQVGERVNSRLYSRWIDGEPGPDEPAYCFGMPLPGGLAEYMIIQPTQTQPLACAEMARSRQNKLSPPSPGR